MRSFAVLPLLTLALGLLARAAPTDNSVCVRPGSETCGASSNSGILAAGLSLSDRVASAKLTNAQRFARGLPPLPPKRLGVSPTRRDPVPSSVNYRAAIQVIQQDNSAVLGYISKNSLNQAQYAYDNDVANALIVDFTLTGGATSATGIDLTTENSDMPNYVYLGLVQGRDDTDSVLQSGSYQYVYIANTNPTPASSPPQTVGNSYTLATGLSRTSESAVWSVDVVALSLAPVWTNPSGTSATIQLFAQSTALYAGGDSTQFNSRYPAPLTLYRLQLVLL
ncbi:uncharacterized protein EI90DRAFT_3150097 [Cantharellus anzutake]|uniref:uncharacterized protein n=1 Tax=Cantharellus anzutake TaxID=1750568 RepID=UPI001905E122|nr:uncharacterized protein EI90DRAFT_3150097 [Cantharellus anzutake]KAF8343117.1 hypothetical protein EI90DRAFT_3150097 [Cantharellus anzutake]